MSIELKIVGEEQDEEKIEERKPMGGTELMRDALWSRLDPELKDSVNWHISRKLPESEIDPDKPNIYWVHDTAEDPMCDFLQYGHEVKKFEKIIFVSNWQLQRFHYYRGIPYEKSIVIQNAIEPIPAHIKPDPNKKVNIIYFSTPHRGLDILLPSFERIVNERDDCELHICSSFKLYDRESSDAQFAGMYDYARNMKNTFYHGTVSNQEIRDMLQDMHIFAYPSTYQETSCLCMIEAMSAGLMCVVPNYGALPETAANFAKMYSWNPDKQKHASFFGGNLNHAIDSVKLTDTDDELIEFQQTYFNTFYNWDSRVQVWENLLLGIKQKKKLDKK